MAYDIGSYKMSRTMNNDTKESALAQMNTQQRETIERLKALRNEQWSENQTLHAEIEQLKAEVKLLRVDRRGLVETNDTLRARVEELTRRVDNQEAWAETKELRTEVETYRTAEARQYARVEELEVTLNAEIGHSIRYEKERDALRAEKESLLKQRAERNTIILGLRAELEALKPKQPTIVKQEWSSVNYLEKHSYIGNTLSGDSPPTHWLEYGEHHEPCTLLLRWDTYSDGKVVATLESGE